MKNLAKLIGLSIVALFAFFALSFYGGKEVYFNPRTGEAMKYFSMVSMASINFTQNRVSTRSPGIASCLSLKKTFSKAKGSLR